MGIVRLLLLFVGVVAQRYGMTPPNVRPPTEQLREQRDVERIVPSFVVLYTALVWFWAFLEGLVLFALSGYSPPALARLLLHATHATTLTSDLTALTPSFLAGTVLTLSGSLLRAYCFRALGQHFTFELSIRPTHALVTDGVYGVIRHPSYTGLVVLVVGYLLCVLDQQGPVVCVCTGLLQTLAFKVTGNVRGLDLVLEHRHAVVTGVLTCLWATGFSVVYTLLSTRMNKEDAMLEKTFGETWRAWAKKVPYRLVPGIY